MQIDVPTQDTKKGGDSEEILNLNEQVTELLEKIAKMED